MTAPTKADVAAADRLLKAAVKRAREDFARPGPFTYQAVVETLTAAVTAADLLLEARDA